MQNDFEKRLSRHLTDAFNIASWNDDPANNMRLILWSQFTITAMRHGADGVREKAEEILQLCNRIAGRSGGTRQLYATNGHAMAKSVLEFCKP